MTTEALRRALHAGVDAFCDALDPVAHVRSTPSVQPPSAGTSAPARPRPAATSVATAAASTAKMTLPAPLLPGRNTQPELSPETRRESLKAAVNVARRLIAMLGPDSPQLLAGLHGQLALERIAFDEALVTEALKQAKKK